MDKRITIIASSMLLFLLVFGNHIIAQNSPVGVWRTIDDVSGEPKSHIEIYEVDGKFHGKIIELLPAATTSICNDCPGDMKDKPLVGLDILSGLTSYKNYWSYGHIVDPANGKEYKASAWLEEGGQELKVRGYIGISVLGRNQIWHKVE